MESKDEYIEALEKTLEKVRFQLYLMGPASCVKDAINTINKVYPEKKQYLPNDKRWYPDRKKRV